MTEPRKSRVQRLGDLIATVSTGAYGAREEHKFRAAVEDRVDDPDVGPAERYATKFGAAVTTIAAGGAVLNEHEYWDPVVELTASRPDDATVAGLLREYADDRIAELAYWADERDRAVEEEC